MMKNGCDRTERTDADALRDILRRGDPAADDPGPAPGDLRAMRRCVVDAAREAAPRRWRLAFATAAAAASLIAVTAILLWRPATPRPAGHAAIVDRPSLSAGNEITAATESAPPPTVRKVQFVTRGGTRIVWLLNRDLDI